MKTQQVLVLAAVVATALSFGAEAFAAGRGPSGASTGTRPATPTSTTQVRPADSQRQDGTFLTSGATANGSATRPTNGNGVMDGTGVNAAAPTTAQ